MAAVRSTDLSHAAMNTSSRSKKLMGALRSAIASKINDGKLTIVENFDVEEAKTKVFRTALNTLDAKKDRAFG